MLGLRWVVKPGSVLENFKLGVFASQIKKAEMDRKTLDWEIVELTNKLLDAKTTINKLEELNVSVSLQMDMKACEVWGFFCSVISVKEHMNDSTVYGSAGAVHDSRDKQKRSEELNREEQIFKFDVFA